MRTPTTRGTERSTRGRAEPLRRLGSPAGRAVGRLASLVAAGLVALAAVGWIAGERRVAAEDWPQWRGPRGDGTWQAPPLPERWPAEGLKFRWRQPMGKGYSGIAVVGTQVFTQDRPAEPAEHERVWCGDARTGETLWQFTYPAPYGKLDYPKGPRATPTVHDGRVYVIGAVGHLFCLAADTGRQIWAVDLVGQFKAVLSTWGYSGSPVVVDDLVIVHAGAPRGCYIAFDRRTGAERWRTGDDPLGYGTPVLTEHQGRRLMIGWTPENVVGVDPQTGEQLWAEPYKVTYGVSIATPIVRDGIVLVCGYWEGSKAFKLGAGPRDVELLWEENRYLRGLMSQPLYRDRHVYLLDKQHGLVCFELATGKMIWTDKNRLTPRDRNPQANLVWAGDSDRTIAMNAAGELVLARLSPAGYDEQSRTKLVGETWSHPAFAGRFVYARDDEQIVCAELHAAP